MSTKEQLLAVLVGLTLLSISSIAFVFLLGKIAMIILGRKGLFLGVLLAIGILRWLYHITVEAHAKEIQQATHKRIGHK